MTEKAIVLETIRAFTDDCSLEEMAEPVEFMAAVQKGLDHLDRGAGIPHDEVKRQVRNQSSPSLTAMSNVRQKGLLLRGLHASSDTAQITCAPLNLLVLCASRRRLVDLTKLRAAAGTKTRQRRRWHRAARASSRLGEAL